MHIAIVWRSGETVTVFVSGLTVNLRSFVGGSRVRRDIFDSYVLGAGIAAAYADATAKQ
jgi:hypothetical protein